MNETYLIGGILLAALIIGILSAWETAKGLWAWICWPFEWMKGRKEKKDLEDLEAMQREEQKRD